MALCLLPDRKPVIVDQLKNAAADSHGICTIEMASKNTSWTGLTVGHSHNICGTVKARAGGAVAEGVRQGWVAPLVSCPD